MKIRCNLSDELINELIEETGEKNKSKIVRTALEDMLRNIKRKKVKMLRGIIDLDLDLEELRGRDKI